MPLRQPGITYSACGPFTKNKEIIQKLKETGDSWYIYQNELDKACFKRDMAYRDFKDSTRRTASDKYCLMKHLILLKSIWNMMDIKEVLLKWFINSLIKKLLVAILKGFRFLLCVIDIYSKHPWVSPLKDKKGITISNAFQKLLKESNRKPNKIWIDKESELYIDQWNDGRLEENDIEWLEESDIEMYLTNNERKSVFAERKQNS